MIYDVLLVSELFNATAFREAGDIPLPTTVEKSSNDPALTTGPSHQTFATTRVTAETNRYGFSTPNVWINKVCSWIWGNKVADFGAHNAS